MPCIKSYQDDVCHLGICASDTTPISCNWTQRIPPDQIQTLLYVNNVTRRQINDNQCFRREVRRNLKIKTYENLCRLHVVWNWWYDGLLYVSDMLSSPHCCHQKGKMGDEGIGMSVIHILFTNYSYSVHKTIVN